MSDSSWRDEASCFDVVAEDDSMATAWDNVNTGWEPTDYEPDPMESIAKAVCFNKCPVRMECLRSALNDEYSEGIRGGYRFHEGRMTQREATKVYRELGVRAKVIRQTKPRVDEQNSEV